MLKFIKSHKTIRRICSQRNSQILRSPDTTQARTENSRAWQ
jgi:hypothetical protein